MSFLVVVSLLAISDTSAMPQNHTGVAAVVTETRLQWRIERERLTIPPLQSGDLGGEPSVSAPLAC
jgi:hypothetical protein